jgi:hypothetical protein
VSRFIRILSVLILGLAGAVGLGLVTSCNITGGGPSGASGGLNLFVTDGPTDDWEQVTVILKSISLHRSNENTWEDVWTADAADPAAGKINLVELNGVAEFIKQATIPVGTYNMMRIVINTDPTTMTLVPDGAMTAIDPASIKVIDPSGKGEIKVEFDPDITVETGINANVMVDFDLAHPLSIVNLDGKIIINLQVRHRALPRHLKDIQFARTIGGITAAATDLTSFTIKTLRDTEIKFLVSPNTLYYDVDAKAAGSFTGLAGLAGTGAALVASNMNADGSLFARRVWYATKIDLLPQFTPEGLVRRVGDAWLSIVNKKTEVLSTGDDYHRCEWGSETVFVNDKTKWTFQDIGMGTGTSVLRHIGRGFRVEVTYVDIAVYPRVAETINVRSAHAEGLVIDPTPESFTLGWFRNAKTMFYSAVTDHAFGWWFYGADSTRAASTKESFIEAVDQARSARLWVFAWAGLYWDKANDRWSVENLVLAPMKLHDFTRITTGYTDAAGSIGVSTYDCWDTTTPAEMTIKLDKTGDLQTVVGSFSWTAETNVVTFTLPVLPANWPEVLTPAASRVKIWVRPQKETDGTYAWHAYSVIAYRKGQT